MGADSATVPADPVTTSSVTGSGRKQLETLGYCLSRKALEGEGVHSPASQTLSPLLSLSINGKRSFSLLLCDANVCTEHGATIGSAAHPKAFSPELSPRPLLLL